MRASQAAARSSACALSRIANFDDLDPLKLEPEVDLVMIRPGEAIPGDATLVIIPGSKSTRGDLAFLRAQGWDIDLLGASSPRRPCARPLRRLSDARARASPIPMASKGRRARRRDSDLLDVDDRDDAAEDA